MAINHLALEGNLVADPELRYTPSGVAVANMRIAHTPRRYDKTTQQWEDGEALFLTVNAWKQLGENAAATLKKGMAVIVTGPLQQRSYQTKEGEQRTSIEVTADTIAPSLRWSTATVQRNPGGGQGSGPKEGPFANQNQQSNDPWGGSPTSAGDSALTNENPPF